MWKRAVLFAVCCCLGACTYYRVSDPASGEVYYTDNLQRYGMTGAVGFEDKRTGQMVTLSSSVCEQITEKQFKRAIRTLDDQ